MTRALTICAALLVVPAAAQAHHVVSEAGVAPVEPRTSAEMMVEAGSFDFGAQAGTWEAVSTSLEIALFPRLSLRGRVPVAHIAFDDGHSVNGPADIELSAKVRIYAGEHGGPTLSAGLGTELPTGSVDDGLGGGHVELVPFVAGAHEGPLGAGRWVALAVVSDRLALGSDGHHHATGEMHGSPLSLHTGHELASSFTGAWRTEHALVSAGSEVIWSFDSDAGEAPVIGQLGAGWIATPRLRVIGGVDLPLRGEERFEWKARAGVSTVW